MSSLSIAPPPPHTQLIDRIERGLSEMGYGTRSIARDVLAADGPIDLVLADGQGRVVLVVVRDSGDAREILADGLAHRAWVAPRIRDWVQLAPDRGLQSEVAPQLLLIAPHFDDRVRAAVRSIDSGDIDLLRFRCLANGSGVNVVLEPIWVDGRDARSPDDHSPPLSTPFRSGLSDTELGLSPAERAEFE